MKDPVVTIVDYNMGNLGSIRNMLKKIGVSAIVTSDHADIARASKLILPGVGAFDTGMRNLARLGLLPVLHRQVKERGVPILGICLGMQLMTSSSEEGSSPGLGWIDAKVVRFRFPPENRLKVPHMGWNIVREMKPSPLFFGINGEQRYYFVHSYHVECSAPADILLRATYGFEFDAGVERSNIFGVQFHPEKSHRFGMQLLRNFVERS